MIIVVATANPFSVKTIIRVGVKNQNGDDDTEGKKPPFP
jgi:hypothetical protein